MHGSGRCCWTEADRQLSLLTEIQALEVLDAARGAYDYGRGEWPTLSVEERIKHVASFACRMKVQREEVVKRLMWEIERRCPMPRRSSIAPLTTSAIPLML